MTQYCRCNKSSETQENGVFDDFSFSNDRKKKKKSEFSIHKLCGVKKNVVPLSQQKNNRYGHKVRTNIFERTI